MVMERDDECKAEEDLLVLLLLRGAVCGRSGPRLFLSGHTSAPAARRTQGGRETSLLHVGKERHGSACRPGPG